MKVSTQLILAALLVLLAVAVAQNANAAGGGKKCCYEVSRSKCQQYKGEYTPQRNGCGGKCKCCYECYIRNVGNNQPCYNAPGYYSTCKTNGYKCCGSNATCKPSKQC